MKARSLIVAITMIFALALTGSTLAQKQAPKSDRPMFGRMLNKLNLTDVQKDKIAQLRTDFQKEMVDLKAGLQKSMIELKAFRTKDKIERSEVIDAVKKVNENKDAIALAVANHLMDMYEILTPEQQKIARDMLPMMGQWDGNFMGRMGNRNFHRGMRGKHPGPGRMQ